MTDTTCIEKLELSGNAVKVLEKRYLKRDKKRTEKQYYEYLNLVEKEK